jgi:hypothetical protein
MYFNSEFSYVKTERNIEMNFLSKMERKFGRFAISHLTAYIILTYVAGYLLYMIGAANKIDVRDWLALSPSLILQGQVWRLVSWWLIPPTGIDIFTLIMLFVYYQLGTVLERTWGDFLYNVYIFMGLFFTVIGAFVLYFTSGIDVGMMRIFFSTYYVSLSIFLGFAMTFPEQQMLFMFLIPIRIKWFAVLDVFYLFYEVFTYWRYSTTLGICVLTMVVSSLASTILFFFMSKRSFRLSRSQRKVRDNYRRQTGTERGFWKSANPAQARGPKVDRTTFAAGNGGTKIAIHHCAVCGRTELDNPNLEFRFCTKCNGNYEYCQDHLYTHNHVH